MKVLEKEPCYDYVSSSLKNRANVCLDSQFKLHPHGTLAQSV